ncbi:glycosyltransferase 25 family member-like isoform X2 [Dreissena polymorpha]|uniref:glycosyltransferase 25 family member-like isoform X2 n=1 Tax=Dreissena polymorpha TaxID=45954 RepID=UPI00226440AC|nr:glycosyltransferase 25 family member-like isoform X2 [Dreissena polymorpha]
MADVVLTCRSSVRYSLFLLVFLTSLQSLNSDIIRAYSGNDLRQEERFYPTVMIATLVRNKAHVLPYFFGLVEKLDYPKDRISLWIRSDHNEDNSTSMVSTWIKAVEHLYNNVEFVYDDSYTKYEDAKSPCDWSDQRFKHVMHLRDKALHAARLQWADYLFMIDADVLLENPKVLKILMQQKQTLVAPMLTTEIPDSSYSNFWGAMDDHGFYKRVPEYFKVLERETTGIFQVPMIYTAFLLDMRDKRTALLSYIPPVGYNRAIDDIIVFAFSAKMAEIPMHVVNTEHFGLMNVPLEARHSLAIEREQFQFTRVQSLDDANPDMGPGVDYIIEGRGLVPSPHLTAPLVPKDKLGFDKVYMINLERRSERRVRMLHVFDILGIEAELIPAVDGKLINASYLSKLNIQILPGFSDPVKGRPMTMGEIGCFLSHYNIWQDVVAKGYEQVVVFEDDLKFEPYFRTKLAFIMRTVKERVPNWDLIYLGRKRLNRKDEVLLEGTESLVWPSYSYWTLSYLLSGRGARKLLAQEPLQKLLPVDEYLPVMFNKHPEASWKEPFHPRNLIALSSEPLLIFPTHYLGEPNYISDTEYSELITEKTNHNTAEEPQNAPVHEINTNKHFGAKEEKGPKGNEMKVTSHFQDEF